MKINFGILGDLRTLLSVSVVLLIIMVLTIVIVIVLLVIQNSKINKLSTNYSLQKGTSQTYLAKSKYSRGKLQRTKYKI